MPGMSCMHVHPRWPAHGREGLILCGPTFQAIRRAYGQMIWDILLRTTCPSNVQKVFLSDGSSRDTACQSLGKTQVRAAVGPKGVTARVAGRGSPDQRQMSCAYGQQCRRAHPATVWVTLRGQAPTPICFGCSASKQLATHFHTCGVSPDPLLLCVGTKHTRCDSCCLMPSIKQLQPYSGLQAASCSGAMPDSSRCDVTCDGTLSCVQVSPCSRSAWVWRPPLTPRRRSSRRTQRTTGGTSRLGCGASAGIRTTWGR